jgi:hypothetical protein
MLLLRQFHPVDSRAFDRLFPRNLATQILSQDAFAPELTEARFEGHCHDLGFGLLKLPG